MSMPDVLIEKPPIYEECKRVFELTDELIYQRGIAFAYYPNIYNPSGMTMRSDFIVHENEHLKQQREMGPDVWWKCYLYVPEFRLLQEKGAYRAQYLHYKKLHSGESRSIKLYAECLAEDLSGALYGKMMSYFDALTFIMRP